jgi:hypothetical protein
MRGISARGYLFDALTHRRQELAGTAACLLSKKVQNGSALLSKIVTMICTLPDVASMRVPTEIHYHYYHWPSESDGKTAID